MYAWLSSTPLSTYLFVIGYLVLNVGLNYFNAFILGSHEGELHTCGRARVPIFYTLCHQVTGLCTTTFTIWFGHQSADSKKPSWLIFSHYWPWLLTMSFVFSTPPSRLRICRLSPLTSQPTQLLKVCCQSRQ